MVQVLCPVVVGRAAELAALDEALQAARIGRERLIVISGEAGIGKSRLAREMVDRARALGVTLATGRAVEAASQVPFRPLAEAVHALIREHGRPPRDRDLEPFHAVLAPFVPAWARVAMPVVEPGNG